MGLFDSLRDALHPDADPHEDGVAIPDAPKHLDETAPPDLVAEAGDPGTPTGGKHARRDWTAED